jgi:long-chain fatty acid transport protein
MTGNFGSMLDYDDNWVGRYRVQEATILGVSFVPSVAYRVNDKLSLGAGVNAMYGALKHQVAVNNVLPGAPDGQLKVEDKTWGWGVNLGLLYELTSATRVGLTWNSRVKLDFDAPTEFSGLGPGFSALFAARGLLDARLNLGVRVPQQAMVSVFSQIDQRWALLGNVGWQQWSKFGEVEVGVENTVNPIGLTTSIEFKDTWHFALGAQYRLSELWKLNFGVAYDSGFQSGGNVSPLLPVDAAWRFGIGGEQQLSKTTKWGMAGALLYGGTLDVDKPSTLAPALGGRGNLVGSYDDAYSVVVAVYGNWMF